MNREKVISLILKNSKLFRKSELEGYTNNQLYKTLRCLFLDLKIKLKNKSFKSL